MNISKRFFSRPYSNIANSSTFYHMRRLWVLPEYLSNHHKIVFASHNTYSPQYTKNLK